jgi:hypothetical protein
MPTASRSLLSVKDFSTKHSSFSEPSLRWLIFNSTERKTSRGDRIPGNGLTESGVVLRVGRKVLIDENRFFEWLDACQEPVTDARKMPCEHASQLGA